MFSSWRYNKKRLMCFSRCKHKILKYFENVKFWKRQNLMLSGEIKRRWKLFFTKSEVVKHVRIACYTSMSAFYSTCHNIRTRWVGVLCVKWFFFFVLCSNLLLFMGEHLIFIFAYISRVHFHINWNILHCKKNGYTMFFE